MLEEAALPISSFDADTLPGRLPVISLKRSRLWKEHLEVPQNETRVGSKTLSKKHTLSNFIHCSDGNTFA